MNRPPKQRREMVKTLRWGELLSGLASLVAAMSMLNALIRQAGHIEITLTGYFTLLFALFFLAFRTGRFYAATLDS